MKVTGRGPSAEAGEADRWQVLTVAARMVDIRGYDNRDAAATAAGIGL